MQSDNESNDDEFSQKSLVLLDLDEAAKKQQQEVVNGEFQASQVKEETFQSSPEDPAVLRRQSLRKRWQENSEDRQERTPEGVLVIRVPEPEVVGPHPHLEILHQAHIKPVQREPSQTEKGNTFPCTYNFSSII